MVFYVIGDADGWVEKFADLIFIVMLLLITNHPAVPRPLRWTAGGAAAISAVLSTVRAVSSSPTTDALDALSTLVVVAITIVAILMRLLQHSAVTLSTVMGAFLAYALIGFAFAFLYVAVDAWTADPFFAQGPKPEASFIYFSVVTLTTVGYGDLTAGTPLAERLVIIEALIGQVFLVVLVARLVSLWKAPVSHSWRTRPEDSPQ